jgi:membrane protein DedA with SNARE-associated domain
MSLLGVIPDILRLIKGHDFAGVLQFLQTSGYGIMFILMLIEGPIITYIAAFAASLGIFNIFYVFLLSFLGNTVGDLILFFIGRVSKPTSIEKYEDKRLNSTRMSKLKIYLGENPWKAIAAIKLTPFLPIPGLILTGASNISLRKFIIYSGVINLAYSLFMIILGFYSGVAFLTIAKYVKYIEYLILGTILLVVLIFYIFKFISKKISSRLEKI